MPLQRFQHFDYTQPKSLVDVIVKDKGEITQKKKSLKNKPITVIRVNLYLLLAIKSLAGFYPC